MPDVSACERLYLAGRPDATLRRFFCCARSAGLFRLAAVLTLRMCCRPPALPVPAVTAHLGSMHSAIKMLISRVALLHQMLLKMQSGA